jgi:hypothetical protein
VGDNLDLSLSGISSVGNINSTGIITATSFSGTFSGTSTLASGLTGSPSITVTGLFVSGVATFSQDIKLGDNDKANFGDGDDLRIYHDGSNSYVEDTGTGDLYISGSSNVIIQHHSTGETMAKFTGNGASELYYDNSKKFETVSAGATVTGTLYATSVSSSGNVTVGGDATISGDLTVNGTQTILNTTSLEVEDLNVGIASTATKLTNSQLDGAGITIYGSQGDKTLTWDNANSRMAFSTDVYAPRYYGDGSTLTNVSAGNDITSCLFT